MPEFPKLCHIGGGWVISLIFHQCTMTNNYMLYLCSLPSLGMKSNKTSMWLLKTEQLHIQFLRKATLTIITIVPSRGIFIQNNTSNTSHISHTITNKTAGPVPLIMKLSVSKWWLALRFPQRNTKLFILTSCPTSYTMLILLLHCQWTTPTETPGISSCLCTHVRPQPVFCNMPVLIRKHPPTQFSENKPLSPIFKYLLTICN
jgi:hypothetical protein